MVSQTVFAEMDRAPANESKSIFFQPKVSSEELSALQALPMQERMARHQQNSATSLEQVSQLARQQGLAVHMGAHNSGVVVEGKARDLSAFLHSVIKSLDAAKYQIGVNKITSYAVR